ncbi:hypothetical protein GSUB_14680 [Geoalkalibacter subterraneus]|uniref:Uncharacterized protein n=1 Tax=Geoalkalibacter subterraneus TaxID=483547 RepID=A0A0B5FTQ2_9BACT|nr:hypothetical protein GSUB_14680 [Geoalkalibacter subterraneus]
MIFESAHVGFQDLFQSQMSKKKPVANMPLHDKIGRSSQIFNGPVSPVRYLLFDIQHSVDFIPFFSESKGKSMKT